MSWTNRVWQEFHAGNLTRTARDVLLTLHTYRDRGGIAWPAHATLADRVGCCVRSVQRALAAAQGLGLMHWTERRVRSGWRWLRTSNLYRFVAPDSPVTARPRVVPATTGHFARGGESQVKKKALAAFVQEAANGPDLLAARREQLERRWRSAARI